MGAPNNVSGNVLRSIAFHVTMCFVAVVFLYALVVLCGQCAFRELSEVWRDVDGWLRAISGWFSRVIEVNVST